MFPSIRECTRAHPESTVPRKMQNTKSLSTTVLGDTGIVVIVGSNKSIVQRSYVGLPQPDDHIQTPTIVTTAFNTVSRMTQSQLHRQGGLRQIAVTEEVHYQRLLATVWPLYYTFVRTHDNHYASISRYWHSGYRGF